MPPKMGHLEINAKDTLRARGVSGTVSYAVVSTCAPANLHESVRSVVKEFNRSSLTDLRNALSKYGPISNEPKLPEDSPPQQRSEDSHPVIGAN